MLLFLSYSKVIIEGEVRQEVTTKDTLITRAELSERTNLSLSTIHRLTRNKQIPFMKAGNHYRYDFNEVKEALRKN